MQISVDQTLPVTLVIIEDTGQGVEALAGEPLGVLTGEVGIRHIEKFPADFSLEAEVGAVHKKSCIGTDDVTVAGGYNGCDHPERHSPARPHCGRNQTRLECAVLSGTLHDPYTDTTIAFQRGEGTSSQVQIDHLVALSDAWPKGAQQWDAAKRRNFANDPINLQATTASINPRKGDADGSNMVAAQQVLPVHTLRGSSTWNLLTAYG